MHVSQSLAGSPVQLMQCSPEVPPPPRVEHPKVRLKLRYPVATVEPAQSTATVETTYDLQTYAAVDRQLELALDKERAQHATARSDLMRSRKARAQLERTLVGAQRDAHREMRLALRDMHSTVYT